jgi:hypothetical protein
MSNYHPSLNLSEVDIIVRYTLESGKTVGIVVLAVDPLIKWTAQWGFATPLDV